jgi:hypothetical protein
MAEIHAMLDSGPGSAAADDNICVDCGLCCDGTLFGSVNLIDVDEHAPLVALAAEISTDGDRAEFAQPCPAFAGGCCTIYTVRPALCRTYKCDLLRRRDVGEVSTADARATIADAIEQRDAVLARLVPLAPRMRPTSFSALSQLTLTPTAGSTLAADVARLRALLAHEFMGRHAD